MKLLLCIFLCTPLVCNAAFGKKCSALTMPNTQCEIKSDDIHPTQVAVGLYEINMVKNKSNQAFQPKNGEYPKALKAFNKKDGSLEKQLKDEASSASGTSGVIGPAGVVYLVNGHHHTYAVHELKKLNGYSGKMYVFIIANKSYMSQSDFANYMIKNKYTWLFDVKGNPIKFSQLPAKIANMQDDPLRSLVDLMGITTCNKNYELFDKNNTTPFLQFLWEPALRQVYPLDGITLSATTAMPAAVNAYNTLLNNQDLLVNLPGYMPLNDICSALCKPLR